ncbi:MAG: hypothetical protein ACJAZC_002162 [Cryomorphaceae bacterium]|jgi:hypothetical protein
MDNHPLRKSSRRIGFSFSPIQRIGAGVFCVISFLMIFQQAFLGVALLLFFAFIVSAEYGFQIDAAKGQFREFSKVFGIKRGAWKGLANFPFVAVLTVQKGHTAASMSNRTVTTTDTVYEVYLLSKTHRTKVEEVEFLNHEKATAFAKEFTAVVEKDFVNYRPQVSPKSQRRR